MKLHGDGVVTIAANVMAGGDLAISQPQALKKAGGAAEARVNLEEDIVAAGDFFRDEWDAWERRGASESNELRLHENLAMMMTCEIQIARTDVYRTVRYFVPS
ncbi:hypothetical protein ABIE71_000294 [Bradyrhizobium diazoefficiens]